MRIFVTTLLVCISLAGKTFACKILQLSVYINIQDSSALYIDFVSDSAFGGI